MKERLSELLSFVRLYAAVETALETGASQPFTADPTMNAYNFRPRSPILLRPSPQATLKALRALGVHKGDDDPGTFLVTELKRICEYLRFYTGIRHPEYHVAHLIVAFRNYTEIKEGRITKWKLLPKK